MRSDRHRLSRRRFLRGTAVTMGLPWLESLPVWGASLPTGPRRFAALFMACGVNFPNWWARGAGAQMQLGPCLEPMAPFKTRMNVIDGLFNRAAVGVGIHPGQTGNLLSGAPLQKGAELKGGISMDQVLANHIGQDTVQPSLVLGCEQPITGYHETNYSMAYSSHISWQSPDSPVPNEVYPALAFDNLFENRGSVRNLSILDRLRDSVQDLSRQISSTDQRKVDEYLNSVREVETRVDGMRKAQSKAEDAAKGQNRPAWTMERPANGLPEDLREHMRLMCDVIAMAFQTDKTRVASLVQGRDLGMLYYPFFGVKEPHHTASHSNLSEGYEKIARFHLSQLAYLAAKLDSMPEGDGTVLDHSCLMFLSNLYSGRDHNNFRLPVVLAGGLGGTLKTGRTLDYLTAGDDNRKMCSMFLGIMDRMDIKLDRFGDATTRLEGF